MGLFRPSYSWPYYRPYYGGYSSVRIPDPLPSASWTCPECGESRSETDRRALSHIDSWRRRHRREHEYERMSPEEAKKARERDIARDTAIAKKEMEMLLAAYGPRKEDTEDPRP